MKLPIYQVDAFTSKLFAGNPAAVVPLTEWLPDTRLQAIARENNQADTAYFVAEGDHYRLRWFTPTVEVDLCGHATLAAAYVLMECLDHPGAQVDFDTRSGRLSVKRDEGCYWLDFPARRPVPIELETPIREGIGAVPVAALKARDHLLVYETQAEVAALNPNFLRMAETDHFAVIATAPGDDCDFVSRFFAPRQGINEDPVTGSAHCTLTPYWAERLGKTKLTARQISPRGGDLQCELAGDRVRIGGYGVLYLRGEIEV